MRFTALLCVSGFVAAIGAGAAIAGGKEEPKPSVRYARNWGDAVAEAKELNVPLVIHSHGFKCPPCWGNHSAVLQNEKYIDFAKDNTVEVLCLNRLDEGIKENDRKAATYDGKDEKGNPVKFMMEWPGLTAEDINGLDSSAAAGFNKTGKTPYLSIVDPFTLQEMKGLSGGLSAKGVMEAVTEAKDKINKEHGPTVKRSVIEKLNAGMKAVLETLTKSGAAKALPEFKKVEASVAKESDAVKGKTKELETKLLDAVKADLDKAEGQIAAGDVKSASALLKPYASLLKGTDLETRVKELLEKTKPAPEPAK
jgi:hypothetical protein